MKNKKIALVLGGGGARGYCHIGVIDVLEKHKVPIDIITGCSIGALVGAVYSAGVSVQDMEQAALRTRETVILEVELNLKPHKKKDKRQLTQYKIMLGNKNIEDCKIKFASIATDLVEGKLHTFQSGSMWDAVRASISIPGLFSPVNSDGMVLVDGGVLCRLPIQTALDMGADIVIASDCLGENRRDMPLRSIFDILEKTFLVMDGKTAEAERKQADILITPDMGDKRILRFKNNDQAIEAGRIAATQALPQIKKLLSL